jgi:ABC-type phosphate/phosphonate transport system permease subunit
MRKIHWLNANNRLKALLIDWLIWAYVPAAAIYYFRSEVARLPYGVWLYCASIPIGLALAISMQALGTSIGERIMGLAPEPPMEERGLERRAPWYRTQVGLTTALVAVVTLVLGWNITQINLYYVFTRADRMTNMTDRLFRPYWPVIGALVEKMIETIFLALMATIISIPIAALVSFFAARNLMYRVTAPYGGLATGFACAIGGAWLGANAVNWALAPLGDTVLDVALIGGILKPVLTIAGLLLGALLGGKLMRRLVESGRDKAARRLVVAVTAALGALAAYVLASLVAMVAFAASWSIFVRELAPWPYLVLGVGVAAGAGLGWRKRAQDPFPLGQVVYNVIRFILNTTRSIEPFVWALIFVTWFRLGPFPGMVALMVHSVASLGKLYSEQIEGIESGPLEAVRATGANELQTVVYAVIPQIIPPFISFTIYRWDINVRMSTIIGLVGGGGVGQLLFQYQNLGQWRSVSVAVILIVAVVMTLDNLSARVREKIV